MKSKKVFVSPSADKWKVQSVGARKAAGLFDRKSEARARGIELAKNQGAELYVQKQNGTIHERNSYGNDPFPPRG